MESSRPQASIQLVYAGTTTGTSLTMNNKNEVFFRNGSNGASVAETYYWWDGTGKLVDADMVFYEGAFHFYAVSGCSGGIYVENVAIHEFGHVLGLSHSSARGATMSPSMSSYCDMTQLTLEADDIAGIESLYPRRPVRRRRRLRPRCRRRRATRRRPRVCVLTWADTSSVESGFRIERSSGGGAFSQVGQVGANVTTFTHSGLAAGTLVRVSRRRLQRDGNVGLLEHRDGQTAQSSSTNTAPSVSLSNPRTTRRIPRAR